MDEKILKLTKTTYAVLDFFPESDPLKNKAKEKVLAIMSALGQTASGKENGAWLNFKSYFSQDTIKNKIKALEDIENLLAYLEIGKSQGWISGTNCLIISGKYENIKKEINSSVNPNLLAPIMEAATAPARAKREADAVFKGRKGQILEFLKKNEQARVMDLQKVLPKVTKRTIRRDLDELMENGQIKRFGQFSNVVYRIN